MALGTPDTGLVLRRNVAEFYSAVGTVMKRFLPPS
jgi:hypothetical protein